MTGDLKIRSQIWGDMEILEFFFKYSYGSDNMPDTAEVLNLHNPTR